MCKTFITLVNCLVTLVLFLTIKLRKTDHLSAFYSLWFSVASLFGQGVEELPRYVLHEVIIKGEVKISYIEVGEKIGLCE